MTDKSITIADARRDRAITLLSRWSRVMPFNAARHLVLDDLLGAATGPNGRGVVIRVERKEYTVDFETYVRTLALCVLEQERFDGMLRNRLAISVETERPIDNEDFQRAIDSQDIRSFSRDYPKVVLSAALCAFASLEGPSI